MKYLHLVYTDNPSRLFYLASNLHLEQGQLITPKNYQHLYITNDEEIKEGDWVYFPISNEVLKIGNGFYEASLETVKTNEDCKKIILTTDTDLIEDGIQPINDEFLEYFIKNPTCEYVEVKKRYSDFTVDPFVGYKIIIPQEEPKQENCCTPIGQIKRYVDCKGCDRKPNQETLEEGFDRIYKELDFSEFDFASFKLGVKWQQEQMEKLKDFDTWKEWKNK
jgi:hypothetical protein